MNIRVFNQKFLEPASIAFSVIGILCLCQPWVALLHGWQRNTMPSTLKAMAAGSSTF